MRTFAQGPKTAQQTPVTSPGLGRTHFGHGHELTSGLHVGRTIGNQAVQRMLKTDAEGLDADSTATATGRFGHDLSGVPLRASGVKALPTNLAINRPGDHYEHEADHVSERIMRMPEPSVQRKCACGGTPGPTGECEACRKKRLSLQRMSLDGAAAAGGVAPPIVHDVLRSPARSLDPQTRAFVER